MGDGEIGPADAHQGTREHQGLVAHEGHAHARRIGGPRVLADRAQIETPGRALQEEGCDRHAQEGGQRHR